MSNIISSIIGGALFIVFGIVDNQRLAFVFAGMFFAFSLYLTYEKVKKEGERK